MAKEVLGSAESERAMADVLEQKSMRSGIADRPRGIGPGTRCTTSRSFAVKLWWKHPALASLPSPLGRLASHGGLPRLAREGPQALVGQRRPNQTGPAAPAPDDIHYRAIQHEMRNLFQTIGI